MHTRTLKSDSLLLVAAFIWGTTFVAQRKGMDHIGPMTYNALRFALGSITLMPVILLRRHESARPQAGSKALLIWGGLLAGLALFGGASFQQIGLLYTTAGKAGFITSLYVVLVPLMGLFLGHRSGISLWIGVSLTMVGLYFLSVTESFTVGRGDVLVLTSALFWAIHVQWIGYLAKRASALRTASIQFAACSALSFLGALLTEDFALAAIRQAALAIAYGGVLSAGVAFTLQILCQRTSPPSHAAIIMSLETVFAAVAGWLILDEHLGLRGLLGCALMLGGLLVVQLPPLLRSRANAPIRTPASPASDKSVAVPD